MKYVIACFVLFASCQAYAQVGMREYQACMDGENARRSMSNLKSINEAIFACSRIVSDASLPADVRARALAERGLAYAWRNIVTGSVDDYKRGLADLKEAPKLDAEVVRKQNFLTERARLYGEADQLTLAIEDYKHALKIDPENKRARNGLKVLTEDVPQ